MSSRLVAPKPLRAKRSAATLTMAFCDRRTRPAGFDRLVFFVATACSGLLPVIDGRLLFRAYPPCEHTVMRRICQLNAHLFTHFELYECGAGATYSVATQLASRWARA